MPRVESKPKSKLGKKLQGKISPKTKVNNKPLWPGPEISGENGGGVTQSMLSRYLVCKERFRLRVIEGINTADDFNHRMEYGQMWHLCEELFAADKDWIKELRLYAAGLCRKYPLSQKQIEHWYNVCKLQFPLYADFWHNHLDVKARTPLLQEEVFNVPYKLSSGRTIFLRGKFDSVDLIGKGKRAGIYLQENKTKGDIKEEQLVKQLGFDLQTMVYLIALVEHVEDVGPLSKESDGIKVKGIRYNVVRRPLSGGKGSIRKHKPNKKNPQGESNEAFYNRVAEYIVDEPESYFMHWKIEITPTDIQRFKTEFLNPVLENLCDDYEWWECCNRINLSPYDYMARSQNTPGHHQRHYRFPYGTYSSIIENRQGDLDEYLLSGSTVGLEFGQKLFGELE